MVYDMAESNKKYDFSSSKCCFRCGSLTHFGNKCNTEKEKPVENVVKKDICSCFQIKTSEIMLICYKVKAPPMKSTVLLLTSH